MIYESFCIKVCISSILPKVDDLKKKKQTNKQTNLDYGKINATARPVHIMRVFLALHL